MIIGDNVSIYGKIDLRTREKGYLKIGNYVKIESGCRIVSAREGKIIINDNVIITTGTIINGGADIYIGKFNILGPRNTINSNEHLYSLNENIQEQAFYIDLFL